MKIYIIIIAFYILGINAYSQGVFLNFKMNSAVEEKAQPLRLVNENEGNITVTYSLKGGTVENINENGVLYQLLNIEGFSQNLGIPGSPQLPTSQDMLIVPQKTGLNVQVIDSEYRDFDDYNIYPIQPIVPEIDTIIPFYIISEFYSLDSFSPSKLVEIESVQDYRETLLATIRVNPIQYNPITKKIRCYSKIQYRLSFQGGVLPDSLMKTAGDLLQRIVANPKPIRRINELNKSNSLNYIIITTNKYLSAVERFARWKTLTGFKTEIVSQNSWTTDAVMQAVQQRYMAEVVKPEYLLIVGDQEDVPAIFSSVGNLNMRATDNPYVCMGGSGDVIPDMARGRISVNTLEEANVVLNKIMNYQLYPPMDNAFYQKGAISSYFEDGGSFIYISERIRSYLMSRGYTVDRIYYTQNNVIPLKHGNGLDIPNELRKDIYPFYPWDGDNLDINNHINDGRFFFFHRDHGYDIGWNHPHYTLQDVDGLTNGNRLPVIFSIDCKVGRFVTDICLAEKFLRHNNGGAVGVIAASQDSYNVQNDSLSVGLINAIWPSSELIPQSIFEDPVYSLGKVLNQGLLYSFQSINLPFSYKQYQNEIYHYFGDPTMEIYTSKPQCFSQASVNLNNGSVVVNTGVSDCKITMCSVDDLGVSDYRIIENVQSYTIPNLTKPYYLSITKHNYIPELYMIGPENLLIQNYIFKEKMTVIGNNIYVGSNVNPIQNKGDVQIKSGVEVIFQYSGEIKLDKGFECELGGSFKLEKK